MNGTRNKATCKHPEGCDRPLKSKDFCRPHWDRLKKTGDVGAATITHHLPLGRACCEDGCERSVARDSGKGMCSMHYQRWLRHGDAGMVAKGGASQPGAANPNWSGDNITYSGAHIRIRNARGQASARKCTDCGGNARHWSYNHQDPGERIDPQMGRYSSNPNFYEPRCVPCHSRHDRQARISFGRRVTVNHCVDTVESKTIPYLWSGMNTERLDEIQARTDAAGDSTANMHNFWLGARADVRALLAAVREQQAAIGRVRTVHGPIEALMYSGSRQRLVQVCTGCGTDDGNWQRWPCPTIAALNETTEATA